jgi:hypothetical protein
MNEGKAFGGKALNQFNGGLFAPDADLEKLHVPNSIFCQHMQGQNEASLYTFKETVLYLRASPKRIRFLRSRRSTRRFSSIRSNRTMRSRLHLRPMASWPVILGLVWNADRWLLLAGRERALIDRLSATCRRLDDPTVTTNIYQGLITSADAIYHLDRRGPRRYLCSPRGKGAPLAYEVEIEDEVMQPLVSGADSRRYIEPRPTTYILFPYVRVTETMHLIDTGTFQQTHPRAWKYLCSYDAELRAREATRDREGNIVEVPFDDNRWYRFGRHQNIDKQDIPKLIVPRLVAKLICFVDARGDYCLDNVDVGGVEPAVGVDLFFIAGLMNFDRRGNRHRSYL